jgi:5-methyltetrahydropteroyltriglutamate--homocysteine methyltransferase
MGRSNGDTQKMARLSARLINDAIKDRPKDMAVCVHLCRGNYQSSWLSEDGYDPVRPYCQSGRHPGTS